MLKSTIAHWSPLMRSAMLTHPGHHLDWRVRRDFYVAVGDSRQAKRFRGWLAILSAQRVLPMVLVAIPWEPQPLQDLEAAVWFLRDPARGDLKSAMDLSYHAHGSGMSSDLLAATFRMDVNCAAFAAYKALVEVSGWLHPFGPDTAFRFDGDVETFDELFSRMAAFGDAAGTAAVASACSAESTACNLEKLKVFWSWWLDSTVPLALRLSEENERLYWS